MATKPNLSRLAHARLALDGLSVGDGFGQCFFTPNELVTRGRIENNDLPPAPWNYTDDTEMAICIYDCLELRGQIDQEYLADAFARRYAQDSRRGYGGTAHKILREIGAGVPWQKASSEVFDGMGSMGNGGAMRVAPLGAFFADDIPVLIEQARLSAEVTHAHPDGQAGATAVALAAAFALHHRGQRNPRVVREFFDFVIDQMPDSQTRAGVIQAVELPRSYAIESAVSVLGNGTSLSAPDTIPYCLWCAARCFGRFEESLWTTVTGGGDRDTNCAIVGGIVALSSAEAVIPAKWLEAREPLRFGLQ